MICITLTGQVLHCSLAALPDSLRYMPNNAYSFRQCLLMWFDWLNPLRI